MRHCYVSMALDSSWPVLTSYGLSDCIRTMIVDLATNTCLSLCKPHRRLSHRTDTVSTTLHRSARSRQQREPTRDCLIAHGPYQSGSLECTVLVAQWLEWMSTPAHLTYSKRWRRTNRKRVSWLIVKSAPTNRPTTRLVSGRK